MKMVGVHLQFIFFLCGMSTLFGMDQMFSQKRGSVIIRDLYPCKDFEPVIHMDIKLRDSNDGDGIVADAEFDLEEEFTEAYQELSIIEQWIDGEWKRGGNPDHKGYGCELLNKYFKNVWKNLRDGFTPSVPAGDCSIDPGHYSITDFKVSKDEFNFPIPDRGIYRSTTTLIDEFNTELVCFVLEVEIVQT